MERSLVVLVNGMTYCDFDTAAWPSTLPSRPAAPPATANTTTPAPPGPLALPACLSRVPSACPCPPFASNYYHLAFLPVSTTAISLPFSLAISCVAAAGRRRRNGAYWDIPLATRLPIPSPALFGGAAPARWRCSQAAPGLNICWQSYLLLPMV